MGKPISIGGLSEQDARKALNIGKMTLYRYRKAPDWPGDDKPIAVLAMHVAAKKGVQGRSPKPTKPKQPARPPAESQEYDEDWAEYADAMSLDKEMKLTMIEVKKATIREYQLKCMQEYRDALVSQINAALDKAIEALAEWMEPDQIENVRKAFGQAQSQISKAK